MTLFSSSDRKNILHSSIVALAITSLGIVLALLFEFSFLLPIGVAVFVFFFLLLLKDPFLFLLSIIPFRMMLDFSGEFFSIRITEGFSLSLSQAIGIQIFILGVAFFVLFPGSRAAFRGLLPLWIFFSWTVVSLAFSVAPSETVRDILRVFDIFTLASIAFVSTKSFFDIKRILFSLLLSSVVPIGFGIWQFASGEGFPREFVDLNRIYGTFGHPNVFGMYLFALLVSSFIFSRLCAQTSGERIFSGMIGFLSLILIFPTLARVSWVITFFFFFFVSLFKFRKSLLLVVGIPILILSLVPPVQDRIAEALSPSADSSVLWRLNIWDDAVTRTIAENRVPLGFGLNAFSTIIGTLHSQEFGSAEAHNDFVKFFVEGGLLGFFIYLFWMGWCAFWLFKMSRDPNRSERDRELSLYVLLFLFSLLLASLSDAVFKSTPIQWIFWILFGAVIGMEKFQKNEKKSLTEGSES